MTLFEQIQQQLLQLPPEKQNEVLDFIIFLQQRLNQQHLSQSQQRSALQNTLKQLAALQVFSDIPDPSAWQRQIRQDRPMPGREL